MSPSDQDANDSNGRDEKVAQFFHELGQLKRVRRSGWWVAGIDHPESVAEHSYRAAAIAFVLAKLEGANPERAATLAIFHDMAETRINDQHHLGRRYLPKGDGEATAMKDQTAGLPSTVAESLRALWSEASERSSVEAAIAKDADSLECLFQAREYAASGHDTQEWVETALAALTTDSAKSLANACLRTDPSSWWRDRE